MKTFGFEVFSEEQIVYCKVFKNNSGAIELAVLPKIFPCNKHNNVVFRSFYEYISKGVIHIQQVSTNDQCDDAWTKPVT